MRPEERARFHTCSDLRTGTPAGDWIELVPEEGGMVELVAFVPGTHESNMLALVTAYLQEGAARLKQEFDFEEGVPTVSILPPASGRVIRTRRARSRWSSTIVAVHAPRSGRHQSRLIMALLLP